MQNQLRGVALSLPFTHISRSLNGNATPKPHNAESSDRREPTILRSPTFSAQAEGICKFTKKVGDLSV
ncbi:hypothetical protein [Pseudanabaena sp. CCNP1317]|nr:hypothetical protein [Pseudanabaena sp. CCNP1317]MEA5487171.1 hypothetical protein [Pseudanabaena sp. CCNP1317]